MSSGDVVGYDTQAALDLFFTGINYGRIMDSLSAYQLISFLVANLEELCYNSKVLENIFPSLMKVMFILLSRFDFYKFQYCIFGA